MGKKRLALADYDAYLLEGFGPIPSLIMAAQEHGLNAEKLRNGLRESGRDIPFALAFVHRDELLFSPTTWHPSRKYWLFAVIALLGIFAYRNNRDATGDYPSISEIALADYEALCVTGDYEGNCYGKFIDWQGVYQKGLKGNWQVSVGDVVTLDVSDRKEDGLVDQQQVRIRGYLGDRGLVYPDVHNPRLEPLELVEDVNHRKAIRNAELELTMECSQYFGGSLEATERCHDDITN